MSLSQRVAEPGPPVQDQMAHEHGVFQKESARGHGRCITLNPSAGSRSAFTAAAAAGAMMKVSPMSSIHITLPDGSSQSVPSGSRPIDIAQAISPRAWRTPPWSRVVNGDLVDLTSPDRKRFDPSDPDRQKIPPRSRFIGIRLRTCWRQPFSNSSRRPSSASARRLKTVSFTTSNATRLSHPRTAGKTRKENGRDSGSQTFLTSAS